jgi:hypothetical protein
MIPNYFELSEDNKTLEVGYNIKKTFPILSNVYLEFRDYIYFFNKVCNTIRSFKLIEKLKMILFNNFLVKIVQANLLNPDLKISRSHFQYFLFIFKSIKNLEISTLLYNFIFGFADSATTFKYRRGGYIGTTEKSENGPQPTFLDDSDTRSSVGSLDYDYSHHEYIRIGLFLMNNMNNIKERINIIIYVLFDTFFERCPFTMIQKLLLPFAGMCLRQYENPQSVLSKTKTYPDTTYFTSLLSIYENRKFDYSLIFDNLDGFLFKTYSHYIQNDIDFYYHYQTHREGEEHFQYIEEGLEDTSECVFQTPTKGKEDGSVKNLADPRNDLYITLRASLSKLTTKLNFAYFSNKAQKFTLKSKLFDDMIEIEEQFNNIYVRVILIPFRFRL